MKIGITCYPTYGGSGAVATELGIELARRGHEVHFISYAQPFRLGQFIERVFFHEVEVGHYPLFEHPPYCIALAATMHEVAVRHGLDLLHVHYAIPHATSAYLAREMLGAHGIPVVTTLHGTDITLVGQERSFLEITRFSIERSDGITAVSDYLKQETSRVFGMAPERIECIPNFIDPSRYDRAKTPCHKGALTRPGEKLVMHISNFRPIKRVLDVVGIFARVSESVRARLVFVGDGPERPAAEREAERLGVSGRVVFLGKQDSVAELLSCADLFLLPSENESFGLSALEAMACGVPVIATEVGGLSEVVTDGSGVLAAVGDIEAMAEAARELLTDSGAWRKASRAARAVATERFGVNAVVPRYESFYARMIAAARRAGRPTITAGAA